MGVCVEGGGVVLREGFLGSPVFLHPTMMVAMSFAFPAPNHDGCVHAGGDAMSGGDSIAVAELIASGLHDVYLPSLLRCLCAGRVGCV